MERLVEEGEIVAKNWEGSNYHGIATDSVVVILVRKGQPAGDQVLQGPLSPRTSKWSPRTRSAPARPAGTSWPSTAAPSNEGKSPAQALDAVKTVLEKTVAQPGSGRDALSAFTQGEGNVLLTLRERSDQGRKGRRRRRIRDPALDDPDRNPDRGDQGRSGAGRGRLPRTSSGRTPDRNSGPKTGTARSTRTSSTRSSSRPRRTCSRSASSAAGARSTTNSSTKNPARSRRSRVNSGSPPQAAMEAHPATTTSVPATGGQVESASRVASASARGARRPLPQHHRPAAAGGASSTSPSAGASATSGTRSPRRRRSPRWS